MADSEKESETSAHRSRQSRRYSNRSSTATSILGNSRQAGNLVLFKLDHVKVTLSQQCFREASRIAMISALLATLVKLLDQNLKYNFLSDIMPEKSVYNGFNATMGTLIVFRTVQALSQYRQGASLVYQIMGSWYDAASTLVSFTRTSKETEQAVNNFQHTVIRLFSLLNMLCMAELENKNPLGHKQAASFDVIDACNLDLGTLNTIRNSTCKVEVVAQCIQSMIVDAMSSGLLNVPPPIITRAFQDLGNGLMNFHTALNIAHVPIPLPYVAVTEALLALHAIFTPLAMCVSAPGPVGAFICTFIIVLLLWSFSFLATELDNPFGADKNDLPVGELQFQLNERLLSLLVCSSMPTPRTALHAARGKCSRMMNVASTVSSVASLKYTIADFFTMLCDEAEKVQALHAGYEADRDRESSTNDTTSEAPCDHVYDQKEDVNMSRTLPQLPAERLFTPPPALLTHHQVDVSRTPFQSMGVAGALLEPCRPKPKLRAQSEKPEPERVLQSAPHPLFGTGELVRSPGAETLGFTGFHPLHGLRPGPHDTTPFKSNGLFGRLQPHDAPFL